MYTKEQEHEALERIRAIIAEAGEDSYIAMAFDGALDLAEMNIADDAGYRTRDYITGKAAAESAKLELAWQLEDTKKELAEEIDRRQKAVSTCGTLRAAAHMYAQQMINYHMQAAEANRATVGEYLKGAGDAEKAIEAAREIHAHMAAAEEIKAEKAKDFEAREHHTI